MNSRSLTKLLFRILQNSRKKKKPFFSIFKSVHVRLGESDRLPECVNTELDWDVKRGIEDSVRK